VAGQYHDLFGWGSYYYPATVAYLGVPGQIYHRNPQLRIEKTTVSVHLQPVTLNLTLELPLRSFLCQVPAAGGSQPILLLLSRSSFLFLPLSFLLLPDDFLLLADDFLLPLCRFFFLPALFHYSSGFPLLLAALQPGFD